MTAVTIAGTFSKDERPSNGLEDIAEDLLKNQFGTHYVVGIVQFAGSSRPGPGEHEVPRVKFLAIEPLDGGAADDAQRLLDGARKGRQLAPVAESLFDHLKHETEDGGEGGDREMDGQQEIRLGPDGEHTVPEVSGEELMAEREEAKAKGDS